MRLQHSPQPPALTFPNRPIGEAFGALLAWRPGHTGNSEKNRKERRKKTSKACYGVRVKETRISTLLYQLNQYLWIEHTQVLQQVESPTAKLFRGSSENNLPFFLSPFTSIEFLALLFALLITWKKVNPRVIFILIFALIVVFYPCGP